MAVVGCTDGYNRHRDVYNERPVKRVSKISDLSWIYGYKDEMKGLNGQKNGTSIL